MIPEKIVRFLEQQANAGFAGTRDRNLMPYGHRVSAWRLEPDRRTLTAFVGERFDDRFLESIGDNGQVAITVEELPVHETYQLKGRYLRHRATRPEEHELVDRTRERFARSFQVMFPGDETQRNLLRASIPDSRLAVEIDVQEIFVQTPGPGAGARIYPPPGER